MIKWNEFLRENNEYEVMYEFTLKYLSEYWGSLDQVLISADKRTHNKKILFHEIGKGDIKIISRKLYYVRFVKRNEQGERELMGNNWFFVDSDDIERQISINHPIKVYRKLNAVDPYGEEDWE